MTTALRILAVTILAAVAGCASGGEGPSSSSSCAGVVRYENRDYLPTAGEDFTVGERLGSARVMECDDTPGDDEIAVPETTTGAYAVEGRDPAEAVAVGDSPGEAILMDVHR